MIIFESTEELNNICTIYVFQAIFFPDINKKAHI